MRSKPTHAPDGGSIPGSLCQEPTGDVTTTERDVDCPDCLDLLDSSDRTFTQLAEQLEALRSFPSAGPRTTNTHRRRP